MWTSRARRALTCIKKKVSQGLETKKVSQGHQVQIDINQRMLAGMSSNRQQSQSAPLSGKGRAGVALQDNDEGT
jgi:hypothetical protein